MFIKSRKFKFLTAVAILVLAVGGAFGYFNYKEKNLSPEKQAQASELIKKTEEKPEAGIEDLDAETMASVKKSIAAYPEFLVKLEVDRQLGEKYITKKQHEQLIKMVDDYEKNKTFESPTSSSSVSKP